MTKHNHFSFDGRGISGTDKYRSRLATLTEAGHAAKVGPLFAAAPDMLAALQALSDWGREHTSPRDANSPHALLVAAAKAIAAAEGHT